MPDLAPRPPVPALGSISRVAKPLALAIGTASLFVYSGCAGVPRAPEAPRGTAVQITAPQSQVELRPGPLVAEAASALSMPSLPPAEIAPDVTAVDSAAASTPVIESIVPEPAPEAPAALAEPATPEPAPAQPAPAPAPAIAPQGLPYDPEIEQWRPLVRQELARAGAEGLLIGPAARLNEDLLLAMMEQESGGDPTAESWAGAMGLLQLMPGTFAGFIYGDFNLDVPRDTILDPTLNVRAGVRYMADALQQLGGDLYWSVSSYNAGTGAAQDWLSVGLTAVPPIGGYAETAAYAPAILSNYAAHRPDVAVSIPAPITDDQIPGIVAMLSNAGLW